MQNMQILCTLMMHNKNTKYDISLTCTAYIFIFFNKTDYWSIFLLLYLTFSDVIKCVTCHLFFEYLISKTVFNAILKCKILCNVCYIYESWVSIVVFHYCIMLLLFVSLILP